MAYRAGATGQGDVAVNKPIKLALGLLAVALVLAIVGALLKALRWLLYVAIVVLLVAGAVRWVASRSGT